MCAGVQPAQQGVKENVACPHPRWLADESKEHFHSQKSTLTQEFDRVLAGKVNNERRNVYGHPLDNFRRASNIIAQLQDCKDQELKHTLEMISVKLARLVNTPDHFDSWFDIAGYARCAVMILDERDRRNKQGCDPTSVSAGNPTRSNTGE
jgi:hypothetical protein